MGPARSHENKLGSSSSCRPRCLTWSEMYLLASSSSFYRRRALDFEMKNWLSFLCCPCVLGIRRMLGTFVISCGINKVYLVQYS